MPVLFSREGEGTLIVGFVCEHSPDGSDQLTVLPLCFSLVLLFLQFVLLFGVFTVMFL